MIVITGAGPIGTTIARQYVDAGTSVRVLTRSGSGLDHPLVDRRAVDVADRSAVREALEGATVVHHCVHASEYTEQAWTRELPPMENNVLAAAAEVGAVVVFPESLYAFDLTQQPITERTPIVATTGKPGVRARLLANRAVSVARTISVVASDYFGPGAGSNAHAGDRMVTPAVASRTVRVVGDADQPHSWTYLPDLAAAMIRAADLPSQPDRILFAPTASPKTQREMALAYARAGGRDDVRVATMKPWLLRLIGRLHRGVGGIAEMLHLMTHPQIMDSSASEGLLGLRPTPWEVAAGETVTGLTDVRTGYQDSRRSQEAM